MKQVFLLLCSLFILVSSWEGQLMAANLVENGPIPEESIRLRIIAHSDSFQDQWLKREVRDAIIAKMDRWVTELDSLAEAKRKVAYHLPELQAVVDETIRKHGFPYQAEVELGMVAFPTKLYGAYVYPAGEYEALRVRIGEAQGENWWCVLFPPLCFIDMSNGDAVQSKSKTEQEQPKEITVWNQEEPEYSEKEESGQEEIPQPSAPQPEIRFFLWDKIIAFFS